MFYFRATSHDHINYDRSKARSQVMYSGIKSDKVYTAMRLEWMYESEMGQIIYFIYDHLTALTRSA